MLYEVVTRANPAGLSPDEFSRRLEKAVGYMRGLQQQGAIRHAWIRIGQYGATTIFDVESHEELLAHVNGNPLVPYLTYKITPLASGHVFERLENGGDR